METEVEVINTENLEEICGCYPLWGRGNYSTLWKDESGKFIYESGVCDVDECEDIERTYKDMTLEEAKDYVEENAELCLGLDRVEDLDELIKLWKETFEEDINSWPPDNTL